MHMLAANPAATYRRFELDTRIEASGSADLTRICLEEAVAALGQALIGLDRPQTPLEGLWHGRRASPCGWRNRSPPATRCTPASNNSTADWRAKSAPISYIPTAPLSSELPMILESYLTLRGDALQCFT